MDGQIVGEIGRGLVVLLGVGTGDTDEAARALARKVAHLRIFSDEEGKMNRSVLDVGGSVLSVSEFTLYGDARKGHRPSFNEAAQPEKAKQLYEVFNTALVDSGVAVRTGVFRAMMQVEIVNDGPVTIWLDTEAPRL